MSYSYYLLHGLTLNAAFTLLAASLPAPGASGGVFWALFLPMFVLTLGPAALLYLIVERPLSLTSAPRRNP
jgi:peptidoglycan/LPS O-acetylase OafA/YrhL